MMYLLTEEEYQDLLQKKHEHIKLARTKLQNLCIKIADEMPVLWGWGDNPDIPKPWGCILTKETPSYEWYCDNCPVADICPNPNKHWSK